MSSSQPSSQPINFQGAIQSQEALDHEMASFMRNSRETPFEADVKQLELSQLDESKQQLLPPVRANSKSVATRRDLNQAKHEIEQLKHANQSLRECWAQTKWYSEEQKQESHRKLAELLYHFEKIEKFYPRVGKLEEQLFEIATALSKNREAHKNKISFTEFEAFKIATRTEFQTLIDQRLEQFQKPITTKFEAIDVRLKELGNMCKEILPFSTFKDYLMRQRNIESTCESITTTLLPGHLTAMQTLVKGKVDRLDIEEMIHKQVKKAMEKIDFRGMALDQQLVREAQSPERVEKGKKVKQREQSIDSQEIIETKRKSRRDEKVHNKKEESINSNKGDLKQSVKQSHGSKRIDDQINKRASVESRSAHPQRNSNHQTADPENPLRQSDEPIISVEYSDNERTPLHGQSEHSSESTPVRVITSSRRKHSAQASQRARSQAKSETEQTDSLHIRSEQRGRSSSGSQHSAIELNSQSSHPRRSARKSRRSASRRAESQLSVPADPNFLKPTISSKNKQSRSRLSSASSNRSGRKHRQDNAQVLKLKSQVQDCQSELRNLLHKLQAQGQLLQAYDSRLTRAETRTHDLEIKQLDTSQETYRLSKELSRIDRELGSVQSATAQHENRLTKIEREMQEQDEGMKNAPADPAKRQKYIERRLVLSERNILKLTHDLDLARLEKKKNVESLEQKLQSLSTLKQEFDQKAEFLYSKITENARILIEQIEGLGTQVGGVKLSLNAKLKDLSKESQLWARELERTQNINREILVERQKDRAIFSQSEARMDHNNSIQRQRQDSLNYDSVMSGVYPDLKSSTLVPRDELAQTSRTTQQRFWQSIDKQKNKPYTARPVPPLLVADLKKYTQRDDASFQMTQDSIHSETGEFDAVGTRGDTHLSTRDKIQNLISQNLSVRSQKSNRTINYGQSFLKVKKHPIQKLELQRFKDS